MNSKPTLLIVDDEPLNLAVLARLLNPHYRVLGARSGSGALELVRHTLPDLILLDVMMPGMDGHEVLRQLQGDPRTRAVPVIFVTALGSEVDEEHGLALGAVDYISKPVKPAVVLARVRTHLELKAARDRLHDQNTDLERELARRMRETLLTQDLTLSMVAGLAETRDNDTGNHILRTRLYVEALARRLQSLPAFAAELDEATLRRIVKAAPLHDIGKIGIADQILLKPGRLTPQEFEVMKTHARLGGQAIEHAIREVLPQYREASGDATDTPEVLRFLETGRLIATHHHERWDGQGYPDGLAGTAIPLPARLMAVADVYDALTMRRVYKRAWSTDEAAEHLLAEAGRHFDPDLIAAFAQVRHEFAAIAARLADA
ncbi:HD-GYP domain-containing protein [Sphaerotilus uruguayifluvii]|uniref:Two-component system response regulator n=1 Tax=Sphaerotilus uruguayifluvii TaxID=2735897 RepID=A0ABX2G0A7_9BURK|nr:HD domain-containing phosphohydrolase [Leptothrix sp. C29]NRT55721.1 putative two-component system response regulator [Leptothrix sp. C29]